MISAQVLHRRKHRAARADHHPRLAEADAPPFVEALARRLSRECSTAASSPKRAVQPGDHLGRERDFGNQHDGALARLQRPADQADVDLGLAAAGHAVQQKAAARLRPCARATSSTARLLLGHQLRVAWSPRVTGSRRGLRGGFLALLDPHRALPLQRLQRRGRQPGGLASSPREQALPALRSAPVARGLAAAEDGDLRLRPAAACAIRFVRTCTRSPRIWAGNHQPQRVHQIAQIPLVHPLGQLQQLRQNHGIIRAAARRTGRNLLRRPGRRRPSGSTTKPSSAARPEGHLAPASPRPISMSLGHGVGEHPVDRPRRTDPRSPRSIAHAPCSTGRTRCRRIASATSRLDMHAAARGAPSRVTRVTMIRVRAEARARGGSRRWPPRDRRSCSPACCWAFSIRSLRLRGEGHQHLPRALARCPSARGDVRGGRRARSVMSLARSF